GVLGPDRSHPTGGRRPDAVRLTDFPPSAIMSLGTEGTLVSSTVFKTDGGGSPAPVCSIRTCPRHLLSLERESRQRELPSGPGPFGPGPQRVEKVCRDL